jgi:cell division initiation protein
MEMLPNDIRQHKFRRGMRGYDTDEVDQFLEHVATVLEDALAARRTAELTKERLEQDIQSFRQQEGALKQAVVTVQNAMSQAREANGQELESIRRKAEGDARAILQRAESERQKLELDLHYLRDSRRNFIEQFRAFCEAQLRTLDAVEGTVTAKDQADESAAAKRRPKGASDVKPAIAPLPREEAAPRLSSGETNPQPWMPPRVERPRGTGPADSESVLAFPPPLVPARQKSGKE